MDILRYVHWGVTLALAVAFMVEDIRGKNVSQKPMLAGFLFIGIGVIVALTDDNSPDFVSIDFLLFRVTNNGSLLFAISYAFFIFGIARAFLRAIGVESHRKGSV